MYRPRYGYVPLTSPGVVMGVPGVWALHVEQDYSNTWLFNASHQPSISIPTGLGKDSGLPTSIMLSGELWDDAGVLQLAHAFQCATDYHLARAPFQ